MSFSVTAGSLFKISAGVPATFNQAGYEALTFTTVGEVRDLPNGFGASWNVANHGPAALRGTQKKKTSRNPGAFTLMVALDTDDAGQILCKAARDSATALYAVCITTPNGDDYYCQVLVTNFAVSLGNQSADQTATISCEVSTSATDVDWVEVLA